jgi:hypothetical protein
LELVTRRTRKPRLTKVIELMGKSPYRDKLADAGLAGRWRSAKQLCALISLISATTQRMDRWCALPN